MVENGGYDDRSVTYLSCPHETYCDPVNYSEIKHLQMDYIDRTLEKYNIMIAKGIIHPQQLMFSCMECNDNCTSCGTGADWIIDSGASSISPTTCLTILLTKNYQNLRILMS